MTTHRYILRPGIAAAIELERVLPDPKDLGTYIWMGSDAHTKIVPSTTSRPAFDTLPAKVRERMLAHFKAVFLLPYQQRQAYQEAHRELVVGFEE